MRRTEITSGRSCESVAVAAVLLSAARQAKERAMPERITLEELKSCLAEGELGLTRLVRRLQGVVHVRVARVVLRCGGAASPSFHDDLEEMAQDVFVALFDRDALALRNWDPERGLSLENYVGLIAERRVLSILRHRRRTAIPLAEESFDEQWGDFHPVRETAPRLEHRQLLRRLLRRLEEKLSPSVWRLFELRFIDELEIEEIHRETGMSPDAIYTSVSRLRRQARELREEIETNRRFVVP